MQVGLDYPNLNHVTYLLKVVTIITTYRLNEHNNNFIYSYCHQTAHPFFPTEYLSGHFGRS